MAKRDKSVSPGKAGNFCPRSFVNEMMLRRATSALLVLFFGIAVALPVSAQTHICRMTGLPMAASSPAPAPQRETKPCCAARSARANAAWQSDNAPGLDSASCCVVRENTQHTPSAFAASPPVPALLPSLSAAPVVFLPACFYAASPMLLRNAVIPRAPPSGFSGLRAPPVS